MEWINISDEEIRSKILTVVKDGLHKLENPSQIQAFAMAENEKRKNANKEYIPWSPLDLARGYSGLCVLFANMDHLFPDDEYDLVGHQYMLELQNVLVAQKNYSLDLWSGITGFTTAAKALSRNGERYQNVLHEFNSYLLANLPGMLNYYKSMLHTGAATQYYDVIQGFSGIGRYLLSDSDQPQMRFALEQVLAFLIELCKDKEINGTIVPGWHVPYDKLYDSNREDYPNGHFNCGMAHGIAGILALMSLAVRKGIEINEQRDTISKIANFLFDWKVEDDYGPIWPSRVSLEEFLSGKLRYASPRAAWCYGDAGIARAIWLAGTAMENEDWKTSALNTYIAIAKRPESSWNIESHTFCHGYAGLLQMTQRMYSESHDEVLLSLRNRLVDKMLTLWNPEEPYGYHEDNNHDIQYLSGLLDGAAGVYSVLIGLLQDTDTEWDKIFLIC